MQKINILINEEARRLGLFYGYWNWFFLFYKDLLEREINVEFFTSINEKFYEADHLFLNSRSFSQKNGRVNLDYLKNICDKNKNLYWFDMRDSAGTTQFEVLPFVKKYVKKQFYKDKKVYFKKIEGGRFYTNYYIKKYNLKDYKDYDQELLDNSNFHKLMLGWNLGVAFFFDYINFSKLNYYLELFKFKYFKQRDYKMRLPFHFSSNEENKRYDLISLMNTNFYRNSVGYQRLKLKEILKNTKNVNKVIEGRLSKKKYYKTLKESKVSVGAYGWGEVCFREFEAITCGTAFMTADMSNIETWPNIYQEGETYLSYGLDFEKFNNNLEILINDTNLRKKLINNSRSILMNCHSSFGREYFLKKVLEIIS